MNITPTQLSQRAEFYHQLGSLIEAGVPLGKALEIQEHTPPARSYRRPIARIRDALAQGDTPVEALERLGSWTPAFDRALLRAGEQSGRMDVCFKLLATNYRERATMARGMISDLLYPAFVFHFAVVLFPFIGWFQSGNTLVFLEQVFGTLLPIYGAVFLIIFACQGKRGERWRAVLERLIHPIPFLGSARRKLALARLATALESLLSAGVPIIPAWSLAAAASGSPALVRSVSSWASALEAGQTPGELVVASREFPEVFASLYQSGELSGQLEQSLKRLHVMFQEEGMRSLRLVAQWAPKLVYMGVVILVATRVISFYAGYFAQLNQVMNW